MRHYIALLGAAAIGMSAANAADMPVKGPVYKANPPGFSWTGCYIGGHVGGGWGSNVYDDNGNGFTLGGGTNFGDNTAGFLAGGQIGCDYQFASSWVIGVEGSASWANIRGSTNDPFFVGAGGSPEVLNVKTKWLASATARLGYTWDRVLLYAKGGAAWDGDKYEFTGTTAAAFDYQASETKFGWTAGAGIEWAFWQHWSTKIEYNYYRFGTQAVTLTDQTGNFPSVAGATIKQQIHAVTLGLNYRF